MRDFAVTFVCVSEKVYGSCERFERRKVKFFHSGKWRKQKPNDSHAFLRKKIRTKQKQQGTVPI